MRKSVLYTIVGVLAIGAIAVILAYAYRPTIAAERAIEELGEANTLAFTADIRLENNEATAELLGEGGSVNVVLNGQLERRSDSPDAITSDVAINTESEGVSVQIDGDVRLIDNTMYVLIEKTPRLFPALAALRGQWLKLPRGASPETTDTAASEQLFVTVDRVGQEEINDMATIKYNAVATDEAVVRMMDSLADILGAQLSEAQIAELREGVASVEEVPVELWIERWSSNLRQLRTTLAVPGGNTIHFTLTIHDVNEPVNIAVPDNARTLEEVAQNMQATVAGTSDDEASTPEPEEGEVGEPTE